MDFGTALGHVLTEVGRPDKASTAKLAINAAITDFVLGAKYDRDLVEVQYAIPAQALSSYAHTIALSEFAGYRDFKYIRPSNNTQYLTRRSPDKIFTPNGVELAHSYYVSGNSVVMKLSLPATTLLVGYYARPKVLVDNTDTHWTLETVPMCIIQSAVARVFQSIGQEKDARTWYGLASKSEVKATMDLGSA